LEWAGPGPPAVTVKFALAPGQTATLAGGVATLAFVQAQFIVVYQLELLSSMFPSFSELRICA